MPQAWNFILLLSLDIYPLTYIRLAHSDGDCNMSNGSILLLAKRVSSRHIFYGYVESKCDGGLGRCIWSDEATGRSNKCQNIVSLSLLISFVRSFVRCFLPIWIPLWIWYERLNSNFNHSVLKNVHRTVADAVGTLFQRWKSFFFQIIHRTISHRRAQTEN